MVPSPLSVTVTPVDPTLDRARRAVWIPAAVRVPIDPVTWVPAALVTDRVSAVAPVGGRVSRGRGLRPVGAGARAAAAGVAAACIFEVNTNLGAKYAW